MIEQIFGIARLLLNAWVAILKRSNLDQFIKKDLQSKLKRHKRVDNSALVTLIWYYLQFY